MVGTGRKEPALTRRGRRKLILFLALVAVSALAGPVYVWVRFAAGESTLWRASIDGAIGGVLLWGAVLFVWPSRVFRPLRRQSFPVRLLVLCGVATLVTAAMSTLTVLRTTGTIGFAGSWDLYAYVIGVSLAALISVQLIQMIGPQAIANVLLGRYHNPVEEQRIFLFVDLMGSTTLAQRLGDLGLQKLISRFVFDITTPILEYRGEIHAYVGDGVIVTWPFRRGARDGNCLRCFVAIQECLEQHAADYQSTFGTVPRVRGGLHGGPVVVSEIGDVKTAVVYSGDTVNTAARLEDAAKRHKQDLMTSGWLLEHLQVPDGVRVDRLGSETLRGQDSPTELVGITRG